MKIAYICDGLVPKCSGKSGCFKYQGTEKDKSIICHHTLDIQHALFGPCDNPESEVPKRFKRYVTCDGEIRYFEEPEKENS